MDFIAMAETLEAQAASLRREHARQAQDGQGALELEPGDGWNDWEGSDEAPADAIDKVVDIVLRNGEEMTGPANAFAWGTGVGESAIIRYRIAAEQPAAT